MKIPVDESVVVQILDHGFMQYNIKSHLNKIKQQHDFIRNDEALHLEHLKSMLLHVKVNSEYWHKLNNFIKKSEELQDATKAGMDSLE